MTGPPRLLVVAADTTFLVQVKDDLEAEGYTVVIATDPKEALTRVRARVPDLIVIDVDAPRVDGWRLCKRLRAEPPLALVPIIFLSTDTSADNRAKGFSLGADDVLAKPVDAERLAFRVAKALAGRYRLQADIRQQGAAEAAMGPPEPPGPALVPVPARRTPAFSGTLEQLGLSTVLNILDTEKKTGRLDLANGEDGVGGTIEVRLGRIVRASVDTDGGGKNREAIYGMLGWSRGIFRFYAAEVSGDDEVGSSTTRLLIDGARAQDEDDGRDGGA